MQAQDVFRWSLNRSNEYLTAALDGLTQQEFGWRPGPESNCAAFVMWHMTRVEDFFVNRVIQRQTEVYEAQGFREKMGTPPKDTGNSYTVEKLQAWPAPKLEDLKAYNAAVRKTTFAFLDTVIPTKLDEVPNPERSKESVGEMLSRVTTEAAHHTGQIAYLRGLQRGLNK
ncbi:MAG: DinB family protein [Chloroflexota bacterium]